MSSSISRTLLALALLPAMAAASPSFPGWRGPPPSPAALPFEPPAEMPRELSSRARRFVLGWAREVVAGRRRADEAPPTLPFELRRPAREVVILSLFEPGERPRAGLGAGEDLAVAMQAGLRHLASRHGDRFGERLAEGVTLQLDRLGPFRRLGPLEGTALALAGPGEAGFRTGVDGLYLAGRELQTFLLPHEVVLQGLVRAARLDVPRLLEAMSEGLGPGGAPDGAVLHAFPTRCLAEAPGGEPVVMERGLPDPGALTPAVLERALGLLARHLAMVQLPDGSFLYHQDPVRGRRLPGQNYVRQAAVVMTALELSAALPDSRAARLAARRGVGFLLSTLRPRSLREGHRELVPPADREGGPSLGAVALYTRALALVDATGAGARRLQRARASLGRLLGFMQRPDGSWYRNLEQARRGEPPLEKPRFYPGEALLALADLAAAEPDGPWRELAARAAKRELADLEAGLPTDHWTPQALGRFAVLTGDRDAGRAAYRLALRFLPGQVSGARGFHRQDAGGFAHNGRDVTPVHSGCIGEALREARRVAWRFGWDPRPLDGALVRLARYLAAHQVRPEGSHLLQARKHAVGGWPATVGDLRQRIDIDGHAGRALLGAWEALHDVRPVSKLAEDVDARDRELKARGL